MSQSEYLHVEKVFTLQIATCLCHCHIVLGRVGCFIILAQTKRRGLTSR